MEDTDDVHAVLNSDTYWAEGDMTDGSTLDWTSGTACDTKYLDVKATVQDAPLLWGWLPFFPDLKARARVEISQIESTNGMKPLGVREEWVDALIEAGPTADPILIRVKKQGGSPPVSGALRCDGTGASLTGTRR